MVKTMEADWSVEIGPDAPVIDTGWPGWIDLPADPRALREAVEHLSEVRCFPALGAAIARLNQPTSGFATTKCDFWLGDHPVDPLEYDAQPADAQCEAACYVDLLPREADAESTGERSLPGSLDQAEHWARSLVAQLRAIPCPHARVELVLREAFRGAAATLGATFYVSACGSDLPAAQTALAHALPCVVELLATQ